MKLKQMTIPLLGLGLAVAPAFASVAASTPQQPAVPGTVNYVEGTAYIDGQALTQGQVGTIDLNAGQELATTQGKVEVLLTPGVFLRVDDNSAVKMISPDLANTGVQVEKGRAGVEVDEIHHENNLQIVDDGVTTRLEKTGYYEFDANSPQVMVFKGKADVELARSRQVKGGHELVLGENGEPMTHAQYEDIAENRSQDDLFNWSRLRSQYLAEANQQIAGEYAGYAPGWFWNPYGWGYTFVGAGPFMSPFGWGFYPLGWYGGWYGGYYAHPCYGRVRGATTVHGASRSMTAPHVNGFGGVHAGGGSFQGMSAGSFHGGRR